MQTMLDTSLRTSHEHIELMRRYRRHSLPQKPARETLLGDSDSSEEKGRIDIPAEVAK